MQTYFKSLVVSKLAGLTETLKLYNILHIKCFFIDITYLQVKNIWKEGNFVDVEYEQFYFKFLYLASD